MTKQISDLIIYNDETFGIDCYPLNSYFKLLKEHPKLFSPNTAINRGYLGTCIAIC